MDKTQVLSLEITTECNLGAAHPRCPNRSPDRYRGADTRHALTDRMIDDLVHRAYREFGFAGVVAWHYYNEPLCASGRMFRLMDRIRTRTPEVRFLLWSNGTLLPEDLAPFRQFDHIVITDYGTLRRDLVDRLCAQQRGVLVKRWQLDGRLDVRGPERRQPCARMFAEMPIDHYGNLHLCCYAWRAAGIVGNVFFEDFAALVDRWQRTRDQVAARRMGEAAPEICRHCTMGGPNVPRLLAPELFAPSAYRAAVGYAAKLRSAKGERTPACPAVALVAYRAVPDRRIREHFSWNDALYRQAGAHVYLVTDRFHALPAYAHCVLFSESRLPMIDGKPIFSLATTKNAAVRAALMAGHDTIIATDIDMAFPRAAWLHLLGVPADEARVPVVHLVPRPGANGRRDEGMTNTVAMTASGWRQIRYNEECVGYGAEDGILMTDIRDAGLVINRDEVIWHVDHPGEAAPCNEPGSGRPGCYGRAEGFNPDRFRQNRAIHDRQLRGAKRRTRT